MRAKPWLAIAATGVACLAAPSTTAGPKPAPDPLAQVEPSASSQPPDTLDRIVPLPEVVVSTARASDRAPIARSVLGRAAIARLNWGQDTPMALTTLPGVYAYSDAGNGVGYSYLSIRGFPQRRISVLINGVPLNDPESHEVYWIDHPDLLASSAEVQVQRGVGSALYGAASVGGSVDLETPAFGEVGRTRVAVGYGSYRTRRAMVEMDSGHLAGDWSWYGRYSRIETDGYRDQSWTKVWSYYLSTRKVLGDQVLRLDLFGGPEETHLAYKGVPQSTLDGGLTGSVARDRRYNPLTYPYEADHFFEPHYEIVHSWAPSPSLTLTQTLFWFDGRGYYDEERRGEALSSYRLDTLFTADSTRLPRGYYLQNGDGSLVQVGGVYRGVLTDVVRRRTVADQHYGWVPRLKIGHRDGELIVGGELRAHDGRHFGEVLGGNGLPAGTSSVHRYYDFHPRTFACGLFAREQWRPVPALTMTADLAWRHQGYHLRGERFQGLAFDQSYDFALPRLGATWQPREGLSVFGSWALSRREPRFVDLYKGEQATGLPLYKEIDSARGIYRDPYVRPERVNDWELGSSLKLGGVAASVNLYRMDFRDELVDYQFNSDLYDWVTTNAAGSVHQGAELALAAGSRLARDLSLTFDANLTLADNHFARFVESVDATTRLRRDGNAIPFFPARLANASVRASWKSIELGTEVQYAGRIFLDASEDQAASIAPRTVVNVSGACRARLAGGAAGLKLRVLNVLDKRYVTGGYFDYDDAGNYVPLLIPAATRSILAGLEMEW